MEQLIKKENINYYEYNEFIDIEEIGDGLVNKIYKANWKQGEKLVALKSFSIDDDTVKEIVSEVCKEFCSLKFACRSCRRLGGSHAIGKS